MADSRESTKPVLNLVCTSCGKPCRSKTERDLHNKRTGHMEFLDKTPKATTSISLEAPKSSNDVTMDEETGGGSKGLLQAKRIEQENERKRLVELRKSEKDEERRVRERIRQQLEEDKAERRRKFVWLPEDPSKTSPPVVEEEKKINSSLPVLRPATKAEQMTECLLSLQQNHKGGDNAEVKTAFTTLLTFVKNVAANPNEEKYHKIRLTNAAFQERVGKLKGGIEFLEICGFEKQEGGELLFLPPEKVDMAVLNPAGIVLNSAINNPFFGIR